MHPEGPNIGPASEASWFRDNSEKTDLLHTGHRRGGKLLIVRTHEPFLGFVIYSNMNLPSTPFLRSP